VGFVKVDPSAVAAGSTHLELSVGDAAMDFIVHEDELADVAPGWIGESARALSEVTVRWETLHTQHKRRTGELGYQMATVGTVFTLHEEHSAQAFSALDPQ
jgi:uncharacterized protein YukE